MKMIVSEDIRTLSSIFKSHGFSLYLVGGAVRDHLLSKPSHDYDFTTDARPEEIKGMFRHTIDTGIKHGTVTVLFRGGSYEITTFRTEGDYSDSRHPDSVTFVRSLSEDLKRRDFTINAFACDLSSGDIIDEHNGLSDLKNKTIRAIGNPEERFTEDALRIMRAARFSSKLGFEIEEETKKAMTKLSSNISKVSEERIREELFRLIDSPFPRLGIETMYDTGLLKIILPELYECKNIEGTGYHKENLLEHHILALEYAEKLKAPLTVKIAALLHDIGKVKTERKEEDRTTYYSHEICGSEMASSIMKRLKSSNKEREEVELLIREHMVQYSSAWSDGAIRRLIVRVGKENLNNLFMLRECDRKATLSLPQDYNDEELKARVEREISSSPALTLKDLKINGKDLSSYMNNGPMTGRVLKSLLEMVIDDPTLNQKQILLERARELMERFKKEDVSL